MYHLAIDHIDWLIFRLSICRSLKCLYPSIGQFKYLSKIGRDRIVILGHLLYWEEILRWVLSPACSTAVGDIRWRGKQGVVKEGQTSDALLQIPFLLLTADRSLDEYAVMGCGIFTGHLMLNVSSLTPSRPSIYNSFYNLKLEMA
jgi:hypothetical protein